MVPKVFEPLKFHCTSKTSIKVNGILAEEANLLSFFLVGVNSFWEKICSSWSKVFPLMAHLKSDSYLIQRSKQEFMQVNIKLFPKRGRECLLE